MTMRTRTLSPLRHLLAAVVLLSGIAACNDTDCTTSNTAYVNYNIYDANGNSVSLTGPVTVTAAGTDSVLINQESNLQSMQLPLRYTSTEDTFVVHLSEVLFDTIFVTHQNIPHFISMECGTGMYYHIDNARCTRRIFDSISVVNPDINFDANEHIQMYMPAN